MEMKNDYADAEMILNQLSLKTNCLGANGQVFPAKYLVCIGDDICSAAYAVDLYYQIFKIYGYYPIILCVGGTGALSKYSNAWGETEAIKLSRVCEELGVPEYNVRVLERGNNLGISCLEIYKWLSLYSSAKDNTIVCLTKRLSLRFKQTFEFLEIQYPSMIDEEEFPRIVKSVSYYVPDESLENMMQMYNCKALCKGGILLSEIASIYDRIVRYSGKMQKPIDFDISDEVYEASLRLAKKYPLNIKILSFNGIFLFLRAYFSFQKNKTLIKQEQTKFIEIWKNKFL